VGRHYLNQFSGCNNLRPFPEPRKVPDIAGHKVVGAGGFRALQEFIVRRVLGNLHSDIRLNEPPISPDELQELMSLAPWNPEPRPRQNFLIFRKNRPGNVETRGSGYGDVKCRALEAIWSKCSRNNYICIEYKPQRDHPRFFFLALAARISRSICCIVILSVPLRFEFPPITRKTSGSGAASFM